MYLSMLLNLDTLHFSLPEEKIQRPKSLVLHVYTQIMMVNPQEVGRTHGFLNFMADLIHKKVAPQAPNPMAKLIYVPYAHESQSIYSHTS